MAGEAANGSPESEVSGLDFEETELKLAPPGGGSRGAAAAADGDRKRGFAETVDLTLGGSSGAPRAGERPDPTADSAESKASGAVKPPAKAQVVGWPPVRSFRRNALKSCTYVKVAVDGAPYLRKVDLELYSGYQQLLAALEEMFSCFTIRNYPDEVRLVDTVNGTEYVPTYEDKDGDWMLVGDVPWKMFVESCKRLRLMKSTEAVNLAPRTPQRSVNTK
uniref:Auxin-responsive protein n=1 Tax=Anthurium amnicola TaxID=1678845 RepID=A0A1D1XVR2_9ARAE